MNSKDADAKKSASNPEDMLKQVEEAAAEAAQKMRKLQDDTGTPVVGIMRGGRMAKMMGITSDTFAQAAYKEGIGVYPSVARAARTVSQMLAWRNYREGLPDIL